MFEPEQVQTYDTFSRRGYVIWTSGAAVGAGNFAKAVVFGAFGRV